MFESTESLIAVFWIVVGIIALIPFIIFTISYRRIKDKKLLYNSIAFFLFFLKAILLSIGLFEPFGDDAVWFLSEELWWAVAAVLDAIIIILIALSLLHKK
ncbi:MAG: hypothetical protein JSV49_01535 [Thermoplasmata archaeon]|nr:MAG: hypothetical protein JSV49_01535 [Thermoplasmata archaeon]